MMELVLQYLEPELLIVVAFLSCIGLFLKRAPWFSGEWKIPFILWIVGLWTTTLSLAVSRGNSFTPEIILLGVMQGTMAAALAVFGNELLKQALQKRMDDLTK